MNLSNELYHYGILGMKWGIRRYQNPDGSLTVAGRRHLEKQDLKWAKKNSDKVMNSVRNSVSSDLSSYSRELMSKAGARNKNGKISATTINAYNKRMADLMNNKVQGLTAPSGRVVSFVAKRGEVGVFMALSSQDYNISQFKNGIYSSGRVAYRKSVVDKMNV